MATKRHMDIKRNITGHNIIIADITGHSLKKLRVRRQEGLLPNSIKPEMHDKIEVGLGHLKLIYVHKAVDRRI